MQAVRDSSTFMYTKSTKHHREPRGAEDAAWAGSRSRFHCRLFDVGFDPQARARPPRVRITVAMQRAPKLFLGGIAPGAMKPASVRTASLYARRFFGPPTRRDRWPRPPPSRRSRF